MLAKYWACQKSNWYRNNLDSAVTEDRKCDRNLKVNRKNKRCFPETKQIIKR